MKIEKKYWKALKEIADKKLVSEWEDLSAKTQKQYDKFVSEIPDIGGKKNMQFEDLNFVVVFFAFYEACGRRLNPDDLNWFAKRTMVEPAQKTGNIMNWNSSLMPKVANKMYRRYKKKIDTHVAKGEWGNTWRFEINPEHHKEGFALHTKMYPQCRFCTEIRL